MSNKGKNRRKFISDMTLGAIGTFSISNLLAASHPATESASVPQREAGHWALGC